MVDWQSPQQMARNGATFERLIHTLLGLYMWEWFISLPFDWSYISGRKKFRWPLIFYFLGRYSLFFALIGIAIALNVTEEIDCQSLYTFNQLAGNAAIGFASVNLSLRTMAVWGQKWYIVVPLVAISLGHWALLLHGILLTAEWTGGACVITNTNAKILASTFIYTMAFDFIVMSLTAIKLVTPGSGGNVFSNRARSKLVGLIFHDGLIFFIIAFLANLIATTFMVLNLNAVMSIIANVPAAIASTIVACRVVRRLANFTSQGPEVFATTTQGSTLNFRSGMQTMTRTAKADDSVHVQMDTMESPIEPYPVYDAAGNVMKGGELDPEAQVISQEFKRPPY
ncbi:hypothetical protein BDV98DRAFT_525028 [Pterulicium gracile]|uniref:Transmembrane protein n=1 Tax=Pterulicium gracile TaxID=1884261 RepID=A0A5C3QWH9_9AGAR|nr:hypothetical protein BDV98DRAFT_525028 [Pterula gracilis]